MPLHEKEIALMHSLNWGRVCFIQPSSSDLGNGVCELFTLDGVVCLSGLFTVAAVDNIDYIPSAATAKDSFHGTGISHVLCSSHAFGVPCSTP